MMNNFPIIQDSKALQTINNIVDMLDQISSVCRDDNVNTHINSIKKELEKVRSFFSNVFYFQT
ncbi:hypothetical protein C4565_07180 [Candidatus Parcubacteria bacterium]|nr:MAG: hypothetical protein C4565_07180 [Candidatus Parcubacteria bacterium]